MQNNLRIIKFLLCALLLGYGGQCIDAQNKKTFNLVTDFGAKADNKTDNYTAFSKAAAVLSANGGGTLIIPKGTYYIASYKVLDGAKKNNVTDILYQNCNGLTIKGNNSTIRINGNFYRSLDYGAGGFFHYAYNNTVCPFKMSNCKNVVIQDLILNGEVDKMRKQDGVVEGENYGININDANAGAASSNIVLQNITTHHFATDGIVINTNGENITVTKCNSYKNARQGLSIVKGSNIKCLFSSFDSTGITGRYGNHAPSAGIDVENEGGAGALKNVLIQNCNLRGNDGFQLVTTVYSENVTVDSCFIADRTGGYSDGLKGVGLYSTNSTMSNCILFGTIQADIADQVYLGKTEQQFKNNLIYSGRNGILSASFNRPINVSGNIFIMLPKPNMETYFPYIQNANCRYNNNLTVVRAERIKIQSAPVTALVQSTIEAVNDFWLINGYDIPKDKQRSNYFYPALTGTRYLKNHFFPKNEKIEALIFDQKRFITDAQADQLLNDPIFTAFRQTSYNKKFMMQADIIRKYMNSISSSFK